MNPHAAGGVAMTQDFYGQPPPPPSAHESSYNNEGASAYSAPTASSQQGLRHRTGER